MEAETIDQIQDQLSSPFRISSTPLQHVRKYLTNSTYQHALQSKNLVIATEQLQEGENQFWIVQQSKLSNFYRISSPSGLYLTATKSKSGNEYFVQLAQSNEGQGQEHQLWQFQLGQNQRFALKVTPAEGIVLYLEYPQEGSVSQEYKGHLVCRPQTVNEKIYQQYWKLSPIASRTPSPQLKHIVNVFEELNLQEEACQLLRMFKGQLYKRSHPGYSEKAYQYATSSFPPGHTEPFLIAYPKDIEDIQIIINLSKLLGKHLVARSGGHQYCGLSSGDQNTIMLSMDYFNKVKKNEDGLVEVGPCVKLKNAAKQFRQWKVSIPHGQCPLVNIGGHAQTGGYGHFLTTFGLCMDYVQAFQIVLADGTHRKFTRPAEDASNLTAEQRLNLQIFRGVLGGNAGSFGIVTKYYFNVIQDYDHPESYGFSKIRIFSKDKFSQVMKVFQEWTKKIAINPLDQSLKGLDMAFTVGQIYIKLLALKFPCLLFEGVYSDPDKGVPYNNQFKAALDQFMEGETIVQKLANKFLGRFAGKLPLSVVAQSFVRKFPLVTLSGRQFDLPYKKRVSMTFSPLKDEFLTELADQTAYLASPFKRSLVLVIQMGLGGHQVWRKGQRKVDGLTVTSIPHRNYIYNFVFDIFYNTKVDSNAEQQAIQLQDKMQKTIDNHFVTPSVGEKRYFWGSFGDYDMTKEQVVNWYYDDLKSYRVLQNLKAKIDPTDVFHSPMTVKLP